MSFGRAEALEEFADNLMESMVKVEESGAGDAQEGASGRRLRVLISAYACEPGRGSEPGVGWNLVRELSRRHQLTVITRANNESTIEGSGEDWVERVDWVYYDPPSWLCFWKKGGRGVQLFYIFWQIGVGRLAGRLVKEGEFDLAHHVTFGRYWVPSRFAGLEIPFVFGPVGGGEETPEGFVGHQHWRARLAEISKSFVQGIVARLPVCRRLFHGASWTFAATRHTEEKLRGLGVTKVSILPQSGIDEGFIDTYDSLPRLEEIGEGLRLVTACRLIHWKAVDLAIEAVARVSDMIDVRLDVLQDGPERGRLEALVRELGIEDRVQFLGRLPTLDDVYARIKASDALMHPALHEAFGQSCIEALALGIPVICLDWAGPGLIVDGASGYKVDPGTREETIVRLADAIKALAGGADRPSGEDCKARATGEFSWPGISAEIDNKYQQLCSAPATRAELGP